MFKSKPKSVKNKAKYHNFDTFPAKVFFTIRDSKNYQLMRPKPAVSTEWLEKAFSDVYDEFFLKVDNQDAKNYIELRNKIAFFEYKKHTIKQILAFIYLNNESTLAKYPEVIEMIHQQLTALNEYLEEPINFDIDFIDELLRVLNVEIGILSDEIEIANQEMERFKRDENEVVFNFYKELVALEGVHGRTLDEQMLLPKYVEILNVALEKSKREKLKNG